MTEFGLFLTQLRVLNNENMVQMAHKLKVTTPMLSKIQSGKAYCDNAFLVRLLCNYDLSEGAKKFILELMEVEE